MGKTDHFTRGVTPRQQRAIEALLDAPNVRAAATMSNVPYGTLRRWMSTHDGFKEALDKAVEEIRRQSARRLSGMRTRALSVLDEIQTNRDAQEGARVSAARTILETDERQEVKEGILSDLKALREQIGG